MRLSRHDKYWEDIELSRAKVRENNTKTRVVRNAWRKNKQATDPHYKVAKSLRDRLYRAIKRGYKKASPTMTLLGCSTDYLIQHLEAQFQPGMSWDNYGDWHIDHIKAVHEFDLSKPDQQFICFNWQNLRPLWAHENQTRPRKTVRHEISSRELELLAKLQESALP